MNQIETVETPEQDTAVIRGQVPMDDLPAFFARTFAATAAALSAQGVPPSGPPFGLYHGMPGDTVDVEAGFPVASRITAAGDVEPGTLPAGRAVEVVHVGPFDTMGETYGELQRWMGERGLRPGPDVWESYLTDPERQPDPATWRTVIHWAVA
ncbi:GyrI-like domain-containing protein [Terrabacter sp. LjRoot27]|uniref:GyrI-like domain-containing protein n=1 Tax=Terrabacter sp. LjRoot27 TaxID=3342306 RepID=UPI003ECE2502